MMMEPAAPGTEEVPLTFPTVSKQVNGKTKQIHSSLPEKNCFSNNNNSNNQRTHPTTIGKYE